MQDVGRTLEEFVNHEPHSEDTRFFYGFTGKVLAR